MSNKIFPLPIKKILSYLLFLLAIISGVAGFIVASKPSIMPIATVAGALAIPFLFLWWGFILYRHEGSQSINRDALASESLSFKVSSMSTKKRNLFLITLVVGIILIGLLAIFPIKNDIDKCVDSGMNAELSVKSSPKVSMWDEFSGETPEKMKHRIRLECMRSKINR